MPFGNCEVPKPGCDGAMTRPPLASSCSTAASGSMPMPGCRNRIGRPVPRSTYSIVVPLTTIDLIASGMREPLDYSPNSAPLSIARAQAVFQDHGETRVQLERNIGMNTAEKPGEFETRPGVTYATHDSVALAGDLYLPKGGGPYPMLVGVHGGGWVQGARDPIPILGQVSRGARRRAVRDQLPAGQARPEDFPARGAGRAGRHPVCARQRQGLEHRAGPHRRVRPFRRRQYRRARVARPASSSPAAIRRTPTPRKASR